MGHELLVCRPGEPPTTGTPDAGTVLWLDVEPGSDVASVTAVLAERGVVVDPEHVDDLLTRDPLPRTEVCDGYRHVTLVGLVMGADSGSMTDLRLQMVECLAGDDWLVTCWHPSLVHQESGTHDENPVLRRAVRAVVASAWVDQDLRTAGDLATAHAEELTRRYRDVFRVLDERVHDWEVAFHGDRAEAAELKPMLGMVNEARRRLTAFNSNRSVSVDGRWFATSSPQADQRANRHLDRMLERLTVLGDAIRADLELVALEQLARQSEQAELSSIQDAQFDKKLGIVTAFLLVPTLIAGIFGANTALPGGGTWLGFSAMVALMAITGPAVWWLIFRRQGRAGSTRPRQPTS